MTTDQLMKLVAEVGDLRESIGAERARLQASEKQLAAKEKELQVALSGANTKPGASAAHGKPGGSAPPSNRPPAAPKQQLNEVFSRMRTNSVPSKVVELLERTPNQEFTISDISKAVGKPVRLLYGALGRMVDTKKIVRVREGVFKAARRQESLKLAAEG